MSDSSYLLTARNQHVQLLTLNRAARHHAINYALSCDLIAAIDAAEDDDDVRVIIINGNGGKAFCAGQDMLEMSGIEGEDPPAEIANTSSAALAVNRVARAKKPVIAAIDGICYGGGALLALACDIRLASTGSTFRLPGAEYGLVVGAAWLPRLVGTSKAKELIFTARKFDANEALACGLLSHIFAADSLAAKALEMAHAIAKNSPIAVRESKRVIDAASLVEAAEALENTINRSLRGSPEQTERFGQATHKVTGRQSN